MTLLAIMTYCVPTLLIIVTTNHMTLLLINLYDVTDLYDVTNLYGVTNLYDVTNPYDFTTPYDFTNPDDVTNPDNVTNPDDVADSTLQRRIFIRGSQRSVPYLRWLYWSAPRRQVL